MLASNVVQCHGDRCTLTSGDSELADRAWNHVVIIVAVCPLKPDRSRLIHGQDKIGAERRSIHGDLEPACAYRRCTHRYDSFGSRPPRKRQPSIPHFRVYRSDLRIGGGADRSPPSRAVGAVGPPRVNLKTRTGGPFQHMGVRIRHQNLGHAASSLTSDQGMRYFVDLVSDARSKARSRHLAGEHHERTERDRSRLIHRLEVPDLRICLPASFAPPVLHTFVDFQAEDPNAAHANRRRADLERRVAQGVTGSLGWSGSSARSLEIRTADADSFQADFRALR